MCNIRGRRRAHTYPTGGIGEEEDRGSGGKGGEAGDEAEEEKEE